MQHRSSSSTVHFPRANWPFQANYDLSGGLEHTVFLLRNQNTDLHHLHHCLVTLPSTSYFIQTDPADTPDLFFMSANGSRFLWHTPDLCLAGKEWIGLFPKGKEQL